MIDIDNWNKAINDSAIRGYEEELEKKDILLREKNKEIERLKEENKHYHTKSMIAKGKQIVLKERIDKANEYIDQVLLYRIPKTKEVYEDIETLQNILNGSDKEFLNDEIKIIEENKKIEKIKIKIGYGGLTYLKDENFSNGDLGFTKRENIIVDKINEIIDYIQEKE